MGLHELGCGGEVYIYRRCGMGMGWKESWGDFMSWAKIGRWSESWLKNGRKRGIALTNVLPSERRRWCVLGRFHSYGREFLETADKRVEKRTSG